MYGAFQLNYGFVDEVGASSSEVEIAIALRNWLPTAVDVEEYDNFYTAPVCSQHEYTNGDTKHEDATTCEHSDAYDMPYEDPRPIEFFNNLPRV